MIRRQTRRTFLTRAAWLAAAVALPRPGLGSNGSARRRNVILDVDLGSDEAVALLLAHYSPAIDLVGITTVFGNATLDAVTPEHGGDRFEQGEQRADQADTGLDVAARGITVSRARREVRSEQLEGSIDEVESHAPSEGVGDCPAG